MRSQKSLSRIHEGGPLGEKPLLKPCPILQISMPLNKASVGDKILNIGSTQVYGDRAGDHAIDDLFSDVARHFEVLKTKGVTVFLHDLDLLSGWDLHDVR